MSENLWKEKFKKEPYFVKWSKKGGVGQKNFKTCPRGLWKTPYPERSNRQDEMTG